MKRVRKTLFTVLLFSLSLTFAGCKKPEQEDDVLSLQLKSNLNTLLFNMTSYGVKGSALGGYEFVEKFYYPGELKQLLSRRCFSNYIAEDYFPDYVGVMDSSFWYDGACENILWIDDFLIKVEEERIAEEINSLDENVDDSILIDENQAEEIEKIFSGEILPNEILGKSSVLKFMEFDDEVFIPKQTAEGYEIVHSVGSNVTRNFYDQNFRLITKETWDIKSGNSSTLVQTEEYYYSEESFKVSGKRIIKDNSEVQILYAENGMISEKVECVIYKEKPYAVGRYSYIYNEDNKVIQENSILYTYNKTYSKITEKFSKKYEYKYNEDEIPPDFEYFENGVLKMRNKYSTEKGSYTSQIFFEGGLAVKTYYENEVRVKDVYMQNEQVVRIKEYEN